MSDHIEPTDRTRIRRIAECADYATPTLHAILDAAYLCHVAFSDQKGAHCIPTACWREGEYLYIHGSNGSRMLRRLLEGADACVTVTHLDGLVLARSAFNHSMNYRSAMVYGRFEAIGEEAKRAAMEAFMERLAPGRQAQVRPGNEKEYAATTVLRIALAEAVAKVRSGGPHDDDADMDRPVWTGVLPLAQARMAPLADPLCAAAAPAHVLEWQAGPA
jgi:nitroimidazol reductase NimA-like FMN-containing flavoprotein (pyridoxamine 5'-phosphate oxidase superfamily)